MRSSDPSWTPILLFQNHFHHNETTPSDITGPKPASHKPFRKPNPRDLWEKINNAISNPEIDNIRSGMN